MQLTAEQLAYIEMAISTASLIKSDNLVIEPGLVRAINENKTALWFSLACFMAAVLSKESALFNVALIAAVAFFVTDNSKNSLWGPSTLCFA
mgnify:CR=1 FL=1